MGLIAVISFFPLFKASYREHTPFCAQFNISENSRSLITFSLSHSDRDGVKMLTPGSIGHSVWLGNLVIWVLQSVLAEKTLSFLMGLRHDGL